MRSSLKRTAERLLATRWCAGLSRVFAGPRDVVLAYHNVVPDGLGGRGDASLHVERSHFARQLDDVLEWATPTPLLEMLSERAPERPERPRVAITFDDAYRGAVTLATEELADRRIPATIFVTPSWLGDRSFWWDDVAFGPTGLDGLRDIRRHALHGLGGKDSSVRAWADAQGISLGRAPASHRSATLEELAEAAREPGITLAPHSWTHPVVPALAAADMERELGRPLQWLRREFPDADVRPWIAWPYGEVSERAAGAASAQGYTAGFRVDGTWIPREVIDTLTLPRLSVPAGLSRNGFIARISGTWRIVDHSPRDASPASGWA